MQVPSFLSSFLPSFLPSFFPSFLPSVRPSGAQRAVLTSRLLPPASLPHSYFRGVHPDFASMRATISEILQTEDELSETVQLVGKDSLSEDQKVVFDVAELIREDFLQQNAFR